MIVAIAAAAAFAISVHGGRWWSAGEAAMGLEIGPAGVHRCVAGTCTDAGLGWVSASERWIRTGTGVWAAGLLSMIALLALAAGVAAKRVPRLMAKFTFMSCAMATVTGALFFVQFPNTQGASIDRGLPCFVAAIALGIAACVTVLRARQPSGG